MAAFAGGVAGAYSLGLALAAAGAGLLLLILVWRRWELALLLAALSVVLPLGPVESGAYERFLWPPLAALILIGLAGQREVSLGQTVASRRVVLLLLLFVAMFAYAATRSAERERALGSAAQAVVMIVAFIAIVAVARIREVGALRAVIAAVGVLGSLAVLVRLAQAGQLGAISNSTDLASVKTRSFDQVGNVNTYGFVVMLGVPILVSWILTARRRALPWLIMGVVLSAAALLATISRGAMLGATAGSVVAVFLLARGRAWHLAALAAVGVAAAFVIGRDSNSLGGSAFTYQSGTFNGRTGLWRVAIELWSREPMFGYGPGSWERLAAGEGVLLPPGGEAHNIFLSGLINGGAALVVIELVIVAAVATLGALAARRALRDRDLRLAGVAAGATGTFVAIISRGIFESTGPFDIRHWFTVLSWSVVALVIVSYERASLHGLNGGARAARHTVSPDQLPRRSVLPTSRTRNGALRTTPIHPRAAGPLFRRSCRR